MRTHNIHFHGEENISTCLYFQVEKNKNNNKKKATKKNNKKNAVPGDRAQSDLGLNCLFTESLDSV